MMKAMDREAHASPLDFQNFPWYLLQLVYLREGGKQLPLLGLQLAQFLAKICYISGIPTVKRLTEYVRTNQRIGIQDWFNTVAPTWVRVPVHLENRDLRLGQVIPFSEFDPNFPSSLWMWYATPFSSVLPSLARRKSKALPLSPTLIKE